MKKPLSRLLAEARGSVPEADTPALPPGFATRVVACWQAGGEDRVSSLVRIWTRTCIAGACLALGVATVIHFQAARNIRASAANAWVLMAVETDSR